jgi:hypothetical protein
MNEDPKPREIRTGGGSYIEGKVDTGGGDFVGRDQYKTTSSGTAEAAALFEKIFTAIDEHSRLNPVEKEDLKSQVEEVKAEAAKGDQADESFLSRRLRNIQRMAPDILDVVLATLGNPAAGFGLAVRKIAERIKGSTADAGG